MTWPTPRDRGIALVGATIYSPDRCPDPSFVLVHQGHIVAVGHGEPSPLSCGGTGSGTAAGGEGPPPRVDLGGLILAPGFLDLQVNGAFGVDVMAGDPVALRSLAVALPRTGCTAFLPTVITASHDRLLHALRAAAMLCQERTSPPPRDPLYPQPRLPPGGKGRAFTPLPWWDRLRNGGGGRGGRLPSHAASAWLEDAAAFRDDGRPVARALGIHLEGPYISPRMPGIHPPEEIRPFDGDEWLLLEAAAEHGIRLVTLAPEIPENLAAIPDLAAQGVVVSAGHTDATYEEMTGAIAAGLRMVTHAGNAMRGLHHREPGALGAALAEDKLTTAFIPDGVHLHPATMRLMARAKPRHRLVAVTDATMAAGVLIGPGPSGTYRQWDGREVIFDGTAPRLADGRLAGSALTTDQALRNLVELVGLDLATALAMLTRNPARLLGIRGLGRLIAGAAADLVILDTDLHIVATLVGGRVAYVAPSASPALRDQLERL
ncbi:MAG: N-acetylglucosamine-6-phosphate deacetylase [Chloroflexi bacterium]|nr:N-acetylglucosamine-6-phosphate deacetylase [Chloroflexota bacterium]